MKIKTITCHDVYNTGAGLQAYALQKYLTGLGHDVEIIDYKPDYLSNHYRLWGVSNSAYDKPLLRTVYNLAKLPGRLRARFSQRRKNFDAFKATYLTTTTIRYASNDTLKANIPEADAYICGSDQIWNPLFPNGRDPAFFLDFAPDGKVKASYAASFSTDSIPKDIAGSMKQWLSDFDFISVREQSGIKLLESLGISGMAVTLDPVFLLNDDEWTEITPARFSNKRYQLIYDFDNCGELQKAAKHLKEENGWDIYSVLSCTYADKCFESGGPLEFLSLIKNAEYVLSNSFHATAFSLIFGRPFLLFPRKEALNTRLSDLTVQFGLAERMISEFTPKQIELPIDFRHVKRIMERELTASKSYLEQVLRKAENID